MSYENPTSNIQTSSLSNIIADANKVVQQEAAQKDARKTQNINALAQGALNSITPKKEALKDFTQAQKKGQQNLYEKVGSSSLGFEKFDANKNAFMHSLIDKYSEIEKHLNNGTLVDEQLGKKDLADIRNMVKVYGAAVPRIINIADKIQASIDNPSGPQLSITGAPVSQLQIIAKLKRGEAIDMNNEGNSIVLTDPETGQKLNVEEFNRAFGNSKDPYLKYEADIKKPLRSAFTNYMKDNEGNFTERYTDVKTETNRAGQEVKITTMPLEKQELLKKAMIGIDNKTTGVPDGMFTDLILQEGESIWEDLMDGGRGYTVFKDGEQEDALEWFAGKDGVPSPEDDEFPLYQKQYETMLVYLSNKALQENADEEGIELINEPKADVQKNDDGLVIETQEDFNIKWNALKPGESLVGPDKRKYTKK